MILARLLRLLTRLRRIQPQVGRLHAMVLRASRGRLRRSRLLAGGQTVLALSTGGRRTRRERTTVVAYIEHGDAYAVAALNLGSDDDPAWALNLEAEPTAWVAVAGERIRVRARRAEGDEEQRIWRALIERLPATANSRRLAARRVPVYVLEPQRVPLRETPPAEPRSEARR
jgi:deazaflavin-dependent oxidoreductase (nitroreductase family)